MFRSIKIVADTGDENTNTAITEEEVAEFIAEADAEIDGKLFDYYATPITGASSLLIVGQISKLKVAHTIKTILEATTQFSDKEQEVQTNLEKKANAMLLDIIPCYDQKADRWTEPKIQLSDASRKATSPKTDSLFSASSNTATIVKGGGNW